MDYDLAFDLSNSMFRQKSSLSPPKIPIVIEKAMS